MVTYTVEGPGLDAVHAGDLDGFLCSEQVGERAIEDGLDLEKIDARLVHRAGHRAGSTRAPAWPSDAFVTRVDEIVQGPQASGRLKKLSRKFFGRTTRARPAAFDMRTVEQKVQGCAASARWPASQSP